MLSIRRQFLVLVTLFVGVWFWPAFSAVPVVSPEVLVATSTAIGAALPSRLIIEGIGLNAVFEVPLGLGPDGEVMVPSSFDQVGWYAYGPTPGEQGPAVVLGHVDSYRGPAVFWRLKELTVGDQIVIERSDGSRVQFEVVDIAEVGSADFPSTAVYGDTPLPTLRLVTCAGTFNRTTGRYSHNTIVYAEMVSVVVEGR